MVRLVRMRLLPYLLVLAVGLLVGAFDAASGAQPQRIDDGSIIPAPAFSPFGAISTPFSGNLPLGLGFPGVGSFSFDVDTPVVLMMGTELAAALSSDSLDGPWSNLTLPAPVRILLRSSVRVTGTDGVPKEWATEVEYIADKVTMALELTEDIITDAKELLSGCLGVSRAVVQVGSVVRSVTGQSEGNSSTSTGGPADPRAVAAAIAETLMTSPEVRQIVNRAIDNNDGKCSIPNATVSFVELVDTAIPDVPPEERNGFFGIAVTLVVLLVAGVASAVVCCGCCMGCCCWRSAEETDDETEFLDQCSSIASTPTLPLWSKAVFYALILCTTGFFLSANLSVGATINLDFTVEGEFIKLPSIYDFSILTSTIEMLKAGVYLLGIILLGFSVIWPYLKLIILGTVFTLSASQLRPKRRAGIMEWIDALGKWSMFDVFALCACMVIFYVQVESPATYTTPVGWYGFTLSMTPIWGMYANLIAQILSQCLSIFALWAHHRAYKADWHTFHGTEPNKPIANNTNGDTKEIQMKPLSMEPPVSSNDDAADGDNHDAPTKNETMASGLVVREGHQHEGPPPPMPPGAVMAQHFRGVEMVQRVPLWAQLAVCAMLLGVIALVVCGFFVTGFTVRVVGVLGLIQEAANSGSSTRYFTPLYVAQEMARVIPPGNAGIAVGTWALIIVFVICVLFVPIAQAAVLLWVWAVPTPLGRLKTLLKANELLSSWQYIEVYLIAVIVGCMQIPVVCALLVGTSCDPIQPGLDWLVRKGFMSHATCFQMQPIVEAGMWCLFSASIILYLCSVIVREAAFELVNTHDPLRAAQGRPLAPGQEAYYARRSHILSALGLVTLVGPVKGPSAAKDTPVASVAV